MFAKKIAKKKPGASRRVLFAKKNLWLLKNNLEKQLFFSKYRLFFSKILLKNNTARMEVEMDAV